MLTINTLGSGSAGNAIIVAAAGQSVMIDLGFSRRELLRRMAELGLDARTLRAVLVTHEHDDHIRGCRVFCDEFHLPLCATARTAEALRRRKQLPERVKLFEPGNAFDAGSFHIEPFSVQHDAVDPVGFVITIDRFRVGVATDLGVVNQLAAHRLCDCNALVIESNYDEAMLRDSARPMHLKRRIGSSIGHLANRCTGAALPELLTARTKLLLLAHISRECNTPELARECCQTKLAELGRSDVELEVISQDKPLSYCLDDDGDLAGIEEK